jgi:hypothetical protein
VCGFAFGVLIDFFAFSEYVLGLMGYDGDGGMLIMMMMMVVVMVLMVMVVFCEGVCVSSSSLCGLWVMGVFCSPVVSEESHQKRRILVCRETKAFLLC